MSELASLNLPTRHIVVGLLAWCLFTSGASADTAIWTGPATGDWDDPANWSTGVVPTAGDLVLIDDNTGQMSNVTAGTVAEVDELRVDAGDTLSVLDFTTNSVTLAGDLVVPDGGSFTTQGPLAIESTGRLRLDLATTNTEFISASDTGVVTNLGSIEGSGFVHSFGSMTNEGVISANLAGRELQVLPKVDYQNEVVLMTNSGLLEATNGGELQIGGSPTPSQLINHKDGVAGQIVAQPQSLINLSSVRVEGGSITALSDETGSGTIYLGGQITDVTLAGTVIAGTTGLGGTTYNSGKIVVRSRIGPASAEGADLIGGGIIELGDPSLGTIAVIGGPLINHDNTIRGKGAIHSGFVNRALIEPGYGEAEGPYTITFIGYAFDPGYATNAGTARATAGNTISIYDATLLNYEGETDGLIEAAPGGVVRLYRSEIIGGVLRKAPAPVGSPLEDGEFDFQYEARLTDVKLEGHLGDSTSQLTLEGNIELDGSLELGTLYLEPDSETEIVGGKLIIGREGQGVIQVGQFPLPTLPLATLILKDAELRLHTGQVNSISRLSVVNEGTISAAEGGVFHFLKPVENAGLIHAEQNSHLSIGGIVAQQGAVDARLQVDEGALIGTGRLIGGTVYCAPGTGDDTYSGRVGVVGNYALDYITLQDVTNHGYIQLGDSQLMAGTIENHGLLEAQRDIYQGSTLLTLSGDGEFVMGRNLHVPHANSGYVFTNGVGHTLRFSQFGDVMYAGANFINEGTIHFDRSQRRIFSNQGGSFEQNGVIQVEGSTGLTLFLSQDSFDNEGSIDIAELARLVINGTPLVNNQPESLLSVAGAFETETETIHNHYGATITGIGAIIARPAVFDHAAILINDGLIAPGNAIGTLMIRSDFSQSTMGQLLIEVDGFTIGAHDRLEITHLQFGVDGNATLAGALEFQFADGLTPQFGDEVEFFSADSITGQFDTVIGLPALEAGLAWRLLYEPTSVTAAVTLAGDFNLDGIVNLADYTLWRNSVGAMGPALAADANGDSVVDTADYDLWKTNFGNTTADFPAAASQAVPEPGAVWMLLAGVVAMAVARRRALQ